MDGRLKTARAIKALSKWNGKELGMQSLRNIISIYITSAPRSVTNILETLAGLGVLTETTQFHFRIKTDINLEEVQDVVQDKLNFEDAE